MPAARNREEFIAECRSGALDGVRAAYRIFSSAAVTGLIDEELVQALPQSLRFICHNGVSAPIRFPPFSSISSPASALAHPSIFVPPILYVDRSPDTGTSHPRTHAH